MHRLSLAALFVSASAFAQTTPPGAVGPDNGFFRPTPGGEPSLTHPPVTLPTPVPYAAPIPGTIPIVVPVEVPVNDVAAEAARNAEIELNRAEQEAAAAQARARAAPTPIAGAFTGQTSERDR